MNLFKVIFISMLVAATMEASGQSLSNSFSPKLDQYLHVINQKMSFNGEVLVAQGNQVLYHQAVGFLSHTDSIPLKKHSTYRIASISKTFTGTLLTIAQQQGRIKFTDQIGQYVPELSGPLRKLTLHQLLTHTSGLPHNEAIEDYWRVKSKKEMNSQEVIAEIDGLKLLFEPGSDMKYSTPGYYLLGTVIERVFKETYGQVLDRHILEPLKMTSTGVDEPSQLVKSYHLLKNELLSAPYRNYSMLKGAGDMSATAVDLMKWSASFNTNVLVNEENMPAVFNSEMGYGYGWFRGEGSLEKYYHGGGTRGFSSHLATYPEAQVSIIILSNVSTLPVKAINTDIEKMVFDLPFEMPKLQQSLALAPEVMKQYVGTYQSETSNMQLKVMREGEALYAKIGGNPPFQIYPKGNHEFFGKKVDVTFQFQPEGTGIAGVEASRQGQRFQFKKQG